DAARRGAKSRTAERGHDRSGGDERPDARDRQRADADVPAHGATQDANDDATGGGTFGALRRLLVGDVSRAGLGREEDGDVVAVEAVALQRVDDRLRLALRRCDTENCLAHLILLRATARLRGGP